MSASRIHDAITFDWQTVLTVTTWAAVVVFVVVIVSGLVGLWQRGQGPER